MSSSRFFMVVLAYSFTFLLSWLYVCLVTGVCPWARMEMFLFLRRSCSFLSCRNFSPRGWFFAFRSS